MPYIIVYGSKNEQEKIKKLLNETSFQFIEFQGITKYQEERSFIYGNPNYGHAVAVIYISGEEPIPFGVLSADINKKRLPLVVYVENNDKAQKTYENYATFLKQTNLQIKSQFKTDSFQFENAHYSLLLETPEKDIKAHLIAAVEKAHLLYLEQDENNTDGV